MRDRCVLRLRSSSLGDGLGPGHGSRSQLPALGLAALVARPLRDVLQRGVNRLLYGARTSPPRRRALGQRLEWRGGAGRALPAHRRAVAARSGSRTWPRGLDDDGSAGRGAPAATVADAARDPARPRGGAGRPADPRGAVRRGARRAGRRVLDELAAGGPAVDRRCAASTRAAARRSSRERLVVAREEERRRLRRDLHDGLGPTLAAIADARRGRRRPDRDDPEAARGSWRRSGADARGARRHPPAGRRLRPPALDELGLRRGAAPAGGAAAARGRSRRRGRGADGAARAAGGGRGGGVPDRQRGA